MQAGADVLVVGEAAVDGSLRPISWEMLTPARQIADASGGKVVALFMGSGIADPARQWGTAGADRLLIGDDPRLEGVMPLAAAAVLAQAMAAVQPAVVLVPGRRRGGITRRCVAARIGVGIAADCVDFAFEGGALGATRPVLGGRALSRVRFLGERAGHGHRARRQLRQGRTRCIAAGGRDARRRAGT